MATIDTKKQIVAQSNLATPKATSITTPKINQYTAPSSVATPGVKSVSTPVVKTAVTPIKSSVVLPNVTSSSVTKYKPTIDEIVKQQGAQAQRERNDAFSNLENEYNKSKKEFESGKANINTDYNDSKSELDTSLYNQNEQLNVSATDRGISYSPQALGLGQVNNIGYNKNLTKLMQQKTQLLSDIDMKIANLSNDKANSMKSIESAYSDRMSGVDQDYMDRIMQLMMRDEDRDDAKKLGSGYSGGGGYSSNFTPYSSNFKPWEDWGSGWKDNWEDWGSNGSGGGSGVDYTDNSVLNAGMQSYKNASTDAYNVISRSDTTPTLNNYFDMSSLYGDSMSLYDDAFKNAPKEYRDEIAKTKKVADNHLFNRAYSNSTNTPYKSGNTYITPALPWNKKTIANNKAKGKVMSGIREGTASGKHKAKTMSTAYDIDKKIKSGVKATKYPTMKKPKKAPIKSKYEQKLQNDSKKQVKKTVSNIKKGIAKLFGGSKSKTKHKAKPKPKTKPKANNRR